MLRLYYFEVLLYYFPLSCVSRPQLALEGRGGGEGKEGGGGLIKEGEREEVVWTSGKWNTSPAGVFYHLVSPCWYRLSKSP